MPAAILRKRPLQHGFTLVELLVVIAIIAVLVAISATMIFRFKNIGDKVVATNNIKQLQVANMNYAIDNSGRFVPPREQVNGVPYPWFENPGLISQLKGISATYPTPGTVNTSLDKSLMDPAVLRTKPAGYEKLGASFGYTLGASADPYRKAQLDDPTRSAAFITANAPHADFLSISNIDFRHANKAIVAYYDGHASQLAESEIRAKAASDIFWSPVPTPPVTPPP